MELTAHIFFIICPLLFLAGLIDAIGAGLIIKNGSKIARPSILLVLAILALKIVIEY